MKTDLINTKTINILVVIRDNCKDCDELIKKLQIFQKIVPDMELIIFDLSRFDNSESHSSLPVKVVITPALFVNGRLKHYGDISSEKLKKIITNKQ